MAVSQHILAAEQHLQLGMRAMLADGAQTLPWIFIQKAQAGVISRAAPAFQRMIADLIQLFQNRQHIADRHPGGNQGLVRVTKYHFGNSNFFISHSFDMSLLNVIQ